ncbi:MAG TPA: RodZ domain-containing protein [Spongiibacteraceae bacterium]|nr:RodZ domain-containing protein [Spongiibacteraceae bacterium]
MLEPNINAAEHVAIETPSAGAMLAQAREKKRMTRATVAERLNLLVSQVAALEESDFARFPGETFVRGHLRSYARLLELDECAVLSAYGCAATSLTPVSIQEHVKWRPVSLEQKISYWRRYSGLAATLVVLVALWSWQQHREKIQRLSLTAEGGMQQEFAGGIDSALNSGAEGALFDSVQLLPNSEDSSAVASTVADHGGNASDSQVQTEEVDKLSLRFSADCWIEIKDRDNKLIVATLKHTDEKLQIEGRGPFKVLLGYAPGVSMAYNGAPVKVDVSEGTRSTRLIVGNS